MISEMEYRKGNYIARMAVLDTDNRRFRGMVLIRRHGEEEIEKFCACFVKICLYEFNREKDIIFIEQEMRRK